MKKLFFIILMIAMLIIPVASSAYDDDSVAKRLSGQVFADGEFSITFPKFYADQDEHKGYLEVVTHGDLPLVNYLFCEIIDGKVEVTGELAYFYYDGVERIGVFHYLVFSHDGYLYAIPRDSLELKKKK
jgi:hypothetical protein